MDPNRAITSGTENIAKDFVYLKNKDYNTSGAINLKNIEGSDDNLQNTH